MGWKDRAVSVPQNTWKDRAVKVGSSPMNDNKRDMSLMEQAWDIGEKNLTATLGALEPVLEPISDFSRKITKPVIDTFEKTKLGQVYKPIKDYMGEKIQTTPSDIIPGLYSEQGEGYKLKKGGMFDPTYKEAQETAEYMVADPMNVAIPAAGKLLSKVKSLKNAGKAVDVANEARPVNTGGDVLRELSNVSHTPETLALNNRFKSMGLEELSPAQLQPRVGGQPTPAQMAEGLIRSKDQDLYNIGAKQIRSAEDILNKYKEMGNVNPESAGQYIKEGIQSGKKKVGSKLGEQLDIVKDESVFNKKVLPDLSIDMKRLLPNEQSQLKMFIAEFKKAKTVDDLAGLNSKMATIVNTQPEFSGGVFKSSLGKLKNATKDLIISAMEKKGIKDPRFVYEQYAMVNELADDTLKGVFKTGKSQDVIKKITASGENIDQFRDSVIKLGEPELMTTVKENWLSELFNDAQFRSKWSKVKKSGVAGKLLSKEEITKIDTLLEYLEMAESTMAKGINPPRSGIVQFFSKMAEKPARTIIDYTMGDELKYSRAIRRYKKGIKNKKPQVSSPESSMLKYRGMVEAGELGDNNESN